MPKPDNSAELAEKIVRDLENSQGEDKSTPTDKSTTDKDKSPADSPETIRLRAEAEHAKREAERVNALLRESLLAPSDRRQSRHVEEPDEFDSLFASDTDDDEDSPKPKRDPKKIKNAFEKLVSSKVDAARDEFAQSYTRDQQQLLAIIAEGKKKDFIRDLSSQGMSELAEDIESYIRDNNISPAQVAMPGVLDVIAQQVVGAKVFSEKRSKAGSLPSSSGRSSDAIFDTSDLFDASDLRRLNDAEGLEISPARAALLSQKEVTFDDWKKVRDAEERRAQRRGA